MVRCHGLVVCPLMIAYGEVRWLQVAVRSYREQFPEAPLVVVDNHERPGEPRYESRASLCESLRHWLRRRSDDGDIALWTPRCPQDIPDRRPGSVWDWAWPRAAQEGYDVIVYLHPDMCFTGRDWLYKLVKPLAEGCDMSGGCRGPGGDIHSALSAWRLDVPWASFRYIPDTRVCPLFQDAEFQRLYNYSTWQAAFPPPYYGHDEGLENWFQAARQGKAAHVDYGAELLPAGVRHWWGGSYAAVTRQHAWLETEEARRYILDEL